MQKKSDEFDDKLIIWWQRERKKGKNKNKKDYDEKGNSYSNHYSCELHTFFCGEEEEEEEEKERNKNKKSMCNEMRKKNFQIIKQTKTTTTTTRIRTNKNWLDEWMNVNRWW